MHFAAQQQRRQLVPVTLLPAGAAVSDRFKGIEIRIAIHAYELFEQGGRKHGHHLDDWLQAEGEVLQTVPVVLHEGEHLYSLVAEVPGFEADELSVQVGPFRVLIVGSKMGAHESVATRPNEILKTIELSNKIDPHTVV